MVDIPEPTLSERASIIEELWYACSDTEQRDWAQRTIEHMLITIAADGPDGMENFIAAMEYEPNYGH